MMQEVLRNFIVFEGIDGTGTTTQLNRLEQHCKLKQIPAQFTCEPTGSEIGKIIRSVLKGTLPYHAETLAYLFAADRAEHLLGKDGIISTCQSGIPVVSDRYFFSSLAYQGITCGDALPQSLNNRFPLPELLIYFSLEPTTADKRIANRASREIFETLSFQTQVKSKFETILCDYEKSDMKIVTIDATKSPDSIEQEIWEACIDIFNRCMQNY
ncbi:MAG TPA: dTMP kinase [Spirochaetia bacterium]|nr:dTMP kinase [Spirochaetales bacterium]HRS65802.1 dTMP kinase [Spirochaetia bacterium]HOT59175.1 dTMP kinase [Spirochaetales bacterium]HPD81290.1 dTMP kinase [Spirochaetales bacterium]HQK34017.1 dTMP kinase [Spirochaetales bacterium]